YVRNRVCSQLGADEELLRVAPLGVDDRYRTQPSTELLDRLRFDLNIAGTFAILAVGNVEKKKNLRFLLDVVERIRRTTDRKVQLIVAGKPGNAWRDVRRRVRRLALEDSVTLLGYVHPETLHCLYHVVDVLAYP